MQITKIIKGRKLKNSFLRSNNTRKARRKEVSLKTKNLKRAKRYIQARRSQHRWMPVSGFRKCEREMEQRGHREGGLCLSCGFRKWRSHGRKWRSHQSV